jgi:hypothetical protein
VSVKDTEIFDMLDELIASHDAAVMSRASQAVQTLATSSAGEAKAISHVGAPCKPLIGLSVDQSSIFLLAELVNRRAAVCATLLRSVSV